MISRLRSTRRSFVPRGLTSRPLLIAVIGVILFVVSLLGGVATESFLKVIPNLDVQSLVAIIFGGIPLFFVGFYFTMGLLWELNASAESESADSVNWLPISPSEYVFASSLSTEYTYSPGLMIGLGFSLPIAIFTNNLPAYSVLVFLAIIASMTGSVGIEVLRSALARASSSFNRVGGRPVIVLRIVAIMLILVLTQLLFNGFIISNVIGSLVSGASSLSFVPIFWPTLAVTKALESDVVASGLFVILSLALFGGLSGLAVFMKKRFWVLPSTSIHLSGKGAITGPSRLGFLGMSQLSVALLRRELRSATRRKEVIRLIVLPLILPVMIGFPFFLTPASRPSGASSPPAVSAILGAPFLLGVGLGALVLAMTSMGQEGRTLWNLGALPLSAGRIVRAKLLFTSLITSIGLIAAAIVSSLLFSLSIYSSVLLLIIGFIVILAEASLGIAIGSRFPDFSEGPRPRFVTVTGSIIGTVLGFITLGLMVAPVVVAIVLASFGGSQAFVSVAIAASGAVGLAVAFVGYRLSIGPVEKILSDVST